MKRKMPVILATGLMLVAVFAASAATSAFGLFGHDIKNAESAQTQTNQPAGQAISAFTQDAEQEITNSCRQYKNHQYEVCFAYIFNSSLADLVPYYKFVHSPNQSLRDFNTYRLGSRYTEQAKQVITNRIANWPDGNLEVATPGIRIVSVHADLATNSAEIHTIENWKVTTDSGRVVYTETNMPHTVTMQRVPSYVLHKWVVTAIN